MKKRFFIYYLPPIQEEDDNISLKIMSWYICFNSKANTLELITPMGAFKGVKGVEMVLRIYEKNLDSVLDKNILNQIKSNCEKAKHIIENFE